MDPREFAEWTAALAARGEITAARPLTPAVSAAFSTPPGRCSKRTSGGWWSATWQGELFRAPDTASLLEITGVGRAEGRQLYFEAIGDAAPTVPLADEEIRAFETTQQVEIATVGPMSLEQKMEYREYERAPASRSLRVQRAWSFWAPFLALILAVPLLALGVIAVIRGAAPVLLTTVLAILPAAIVGLVFLLEPLARWIRRARLRRRSRSRR